MDHATLIALPGAGSTDEFVRRIFPTLSDVSVVALRHSTTLMNELDRIMDDATSPIWLAGVSYGAHLAASIAGTDPRVQGLIAIAPAWTGAPSALADFGRHTAHSMRERGIADTLDAMRDGNISSWVHEELARAWSDMDAEDLATHLELVASTPAPSSELLATVRCASVIVGFTDDPSHPWSVAEHWHHSIPHSRLLAVPLASAGCARTNLGGPALANLRDLWSTFERIGNFDGNVHGLNDFR